MKKLLVVLGLVIAGPAVAMCWDGYLRNSRNEVIAGQMVTVCTYEVMGDYVDVMIPFAKLCPITKRFCF